MNTTSTERDAPVGSTRPTTGATEPIDDVSAAAAALRALAAADGGEVLAQQLSRLVMVIADEAVRTKRFRGDLLAALAVEPAADPAAEPPASGPLTRTQLQRMTKGELKKLIDRGGMDRDRTLRSRSTKGEMVELIVAFRESRTEVAPATPADSPAAPLMESAGAVASQAEVQPQPAPPAVSPTAPPAAGASSASEAETPDAALSLPPANPPKRRRRPSPLDPYAVAASDGVDRLRDQLQRFNIEELKDVIAEYGMNYDGRAMGWRDRSRFVDRIIEKANFGATQGNAFRSGR